MVATQRCFSFIGQIFTVDQSFYLKINYPRGVSYTQTFHVKWSIP
jgi:hypothetical protein